MYLTNNLSHRKAICISFLLIYSPIFFSANLPQLSIHRREDEFLQLLLSALGEEKRENFDLVEEDDDYKGMKERELEYNGMDEERREYGGLEAVASNEGKYINLLDRNSSQFNLFNRVMLSRLFKSKPKKIRDHVWESFSRITLLTVGKICDDL